MTIERGRNAVVTRYAKLAGDYDARWSSYVQAATEETMKRDCHSFVVGEI